MPKDASKGDYYTTIHLCVPKGIINRDVVKRCYLTLSVLSQDSNLNDYKVEVLNPKNFHISLTKGIELRYHFIESFLKSLTGVIMNFQSFPVTLECNKINVYANEARSKYFAGIGISNLSSKSKIQQLLNELEKEIEKFGFSQYKIVPHISIVSTTSNVSKGLGLRYADLDAYMWEDVNINSTSLVIDNEKIEETITKLLEETEDEDDNDNQFDACIVDYGKDITSFHASSVTVTIGSRAHVIYFK